MAEPVRDTEQEQRQQRKTGAGRKSALGIGAALLVALSKLKTGAFLLLKLGKPIWMMAISVGAYAILYPWEFAIGLVLLLFVHELGHVWAAKRVGLPVSAPIFIPFLGAAIIMKRHPKDAKTEAYMALGGPLLGTVGAFACYAVGWWTDYHLWYALAYVGFLLNLINLMPMRPLDGGRIVGAVSRWLWAVGVAGGPFLIWYTKSPLFFLLWAWFVWEMYNRFFRQKRKKPKFLADGQYVAIVDPHLPEWYLKSGEHRRELPFTCYCRMDGEHVAEFHWEAMSYRGELPLSEPCLIHKMYVTNITEPNAAGSVQFTVRAEGERFLQETFYDVPMPVRVKIGVVYGGLIGVLVFLIWKMGEMGLKTL
ncbi:site-2 protease family protein [Cohnella faecalis]|uniref:Site-2 protease family protein n=1 Tax=Cohnella faecalis TaxID=2315694 RepID=A0A398CNY7_9BACL|nr:site-2 protease family protein [Cohnella faecalis]RIE04082.1 site-2 protease family protein [Cohnella faecalis]